MFSYGVDFSNNTKESALFYIQGINRFVIDHFTLLLMWLWLSVPSPHINSYGQKQYGGDRSLLYIKFIRLCSDLSSDLSSLLYC